ncbi:hypothetical protein, conserved [Babesia bigemina]|uniref:Uncharacterized protein n=1 Tax=Babesia bigemina TaxID=5866 RepID=A0A061D005_BABBI|nr:hypothetical protein, conserved [Babesia bigemina]CDR94176.1 hypothetical protein, conserved [Babesia bigemina]|eukprot:XP_012766362.1 hypothetical protein, conserved [Babesia bigemina]
MANSAVESPCFPRNILRKTCAYSVGNCPNGPIAQLYYLSAKIYRCVNYAFNTLQPSDKFIEGEYAAGVHQRVSVSLVKSEVEEMIRLNSVAAQGCHYDVSSTACDDSTDDHESDSGIPTPSCGISFDFADVGAEDRGDDSAFVTRLDAGEAKLPPDMDEFLELLMVCAKEVGQPV